METVEELGQRCPAHIRVNNPAPAAPPLRPPRAPRAVPDEAHRCTGTKKDGTQCQNKRKNGEHCGVHAPKEGVVAPAICTSHLRNGNPCTRKAVNGGDVCKVHAAVVERARQVVVRNTWREFEQPFVDQVFTASAIRLQTIHNELNVKRHEWREAINAIPHVEETIQRLARELTAVRNQYFDIRERNRYVHWGMNHGRRMLPFEELPRGDHRARSAERVNTVLQVLNAEYDEMERQRPLIQQNAPPRVQAATELGRLAADGQNVHTRMVTQMEAETIAMLGEPEPGVNTLAELKLTWNTREFDSPGMRIHVLNDVRRMYNYQLRTDPEQPNTYRVLLDRVWCFIKRHSMREDLERRLYEEMRDSVQMCHQGHMARLVNALQGFDAAPPPQVSVGERLQTAMSQISELDPAEREAAARRVFAELGVEGDAQTPWLEALA
jgi:hypothetical protein